MTIGSIRTRIFSRQPLSALGKTVVVALLIIAALFVILAIVSSQVAILVSAVIILLLAAFVASGVRWAPVIPVVLCAFALNVFITGSSFPLYHLGHPKDALPIPLLSYALFVVMVALFSCFLLNIVAGIAALIQNFTQRERRTPRWYTPALTCALGVIAGALIIGALSQPAAATATTSASTTNGVPTVHLGAFNFVQSSVTVPKGAKLMLVDDGTFHHNINSGSWVNGQPQSENQAGEPVVKDLDINQAGKTVEIGPFTTAGTYHLYCALHSGMTLTITVQ